MKKKSLIIAVIVFLFDILIKYIVDKSFYYGILKSIIPGFFYLTKVYNDGAAWSTFEGTRILLIVIAIIPILETLSVILQVAYFKKTGNRIFKMAPLHHHFELSGWNENKVVRVFSVITLLVSTLGILMV